MHDRILNYSYILLTISLTVYGQLILKWRIRDFGPLTTDSSSRLHYLLSLLMDPAILSGFVAAFLASLAWMMALTKFDLSHAYPFMSLNFVLVLAFGWWLLGEPVSLQKVAGILIIVLGTIIASGG